MKKLQFLYTFFLSCLALTFSVRSEACSNVLVTKGASVDGSNMITYAADSHALFGELYFLPAADWKAGSMREVRDWDTGRYLGMIPQPAHTYQRVGNMNEHQVIIAETTYGGRHELCDTTGIVDYGSLIYIALERAKTAREAIQVMTTLPQEYGYFSEGESFSIADKDEVWILEVIGKGMKMVDGKNVNKGIVWVARRVPDGYICAHANQSRISTFPLDDPENCMYSEDVITFAREMGYFDGKDEDFSFCDAYAPLDFMAMRGCEARAWSAFNILTQGNFTFVDEGGNEITRPANDYLDYAMGFDKTKRFPLFVKPSEKVSLKALADVMRDHYEGTPMDMTADIGAGGNECPYRWRPMTFEVDGVTYMNERAIATQQTGFWFVGQARPWLPDVIGSLIWFGCDDAATSYLTPVYVNTLDVPESLREGNGDILTYSPTSAFWVCNRVANSCYKMYNHMHAEVKAHYDAWENAQIAGIPEVDEAAMLLYDKAVKGRKSSKKMLKVREYLTEYSLNAAADIFSQWCELEELLLIKFLDGNIKGQNPDGSFKRSDLNPRNPGEIKNRPYSEIWQRTVARDHGEVIRVR